MKETVLITSNAYFPNIGGVENSLRYLADSYKNLGFNVIVVVSNIASDGSTLPAEEAIDGIAIYRYPTYISDKGILKYFRALRSANSARNLLTKLNKSNNIVLTLSRFHTATLIALIAKLPNIVYLVPGIVKYQNSSENLTLNRGLQKVKHFLSHTLHHNIQVLALKYCKQILVFSKNMEEQIISLLPNIKSLPILKPGVDVNRFKPVNNKQDLRQQYNIPKEKFILLTVGRFVRAKGFDLVIDAIKELPTCHLVMVGDGENMASSQQHIVENNLSEQVTLVGSQEDTAPFYQIADVFIMSSKYEPLGQTILEALSTALPVIAFKGNKIATATSEMLSEAEAVFTEEVSAQGIIDSVTLLLNDESLAESIAIQSREIAKTRFSWDTLAKQTLAYKKK